MNSLQHLLAFPLRKRSLLFYVGLRSGLVLQVDSGSAPKAVIWLWPRSSGRLWLQVPLLTSEPCGLEMNESSEERYLIGPSRACLTKRRPRPSGKEGIRPGKQRLGEKWRESPSIWERLFLGGLQAAGRIIRFLEFLQACFILFLSECVSLTCSLFSVFRLPRVPREGGTKSFLVRGGGPGK